MGRHDTSGYADMDARIDFNQSVEWIPQGAAPPLTFSLCFKGDTMSLYRMNCAGKGLWYAVEVVSVEDELENIEAYVSEGSVVAFCDDLESAADDLEINAEDIRLVEREDDDA